MTWRIDYSKDAIKFIQKQNIHPKIREELKKFLLRAKGENISVDIKKLGGKWICYYRLRKGKLRIIFKVNKDERQLFIEKIDFRGDAYK
ncbi:MAG: type II toxin-antitoxin system RelE family toxin [Candidatus Aminicenantes bacterium]